MAEVTQQKQPSTLPIVYLKYVGFSFVVQHLFLSSFFLGVATVIKRKHNKIRIQRNLDRIYLFLLAVLCPSIPLDFQGLGVPAM